MKIKTNGGLVEMFCMGLLLLLFGVGAYTLIMMGNDGFARMLARRDASANVRIALSFAANQVRNADAGGVSVRETQAGNALVLTQLFNGAWYETYIYWHDNTLKECFQAVDTPFAPETGERLTVLGGLILSCPDGQAIQVTAWDGEGADRREASLVLVPRGGTDGEARV